MILPRANVKTNTPASDAEGDSHTVPTTSKGVALALVVVLGMSALVLRVWGAAWSLPYVDHPDEPAVVNVVLRIVQGKLDPDFFFYPSLMLYLQALLFKVHFLWGLQTGLYQAPIVYPKTTDFYTTIPGIFVWGRVLTATLGSSTVCALAWWGGREFGRWVGGIAAGLLLISPWAITHAHYVTVDIPAAATATLAVLGAVWVMRAGTWRSYLITGLLAGLATATKYQAVLVVVPLALAHVFHWRGALLRMSGRLVAAGFVAAAIFLLTSPFVVLDFAAFSRDMRTLFGSYQDAHGDVTGHWPIWNYLLFLWQEGLGPLPALLALGGAWHLARKAPALLCVLLAFPLLLVLLLLQPATHFWRNLLPIQPLLLVLSGYGAVLFWHLLRRYLPVRFRMIAALLAMALLFVPILVPAITVDAAFAKPDSRIAAQEHIFRERPGVRVASELAHPLLTYGLSQLAHVNYLPLHTPDWYRQQGFGLLLASSDARRSYAWTPDYQPLLQSSKVIATYGGPGTPYRGPRIDVIDTGLSTATLPVQEPQARIGPLQLLGATLGPLGDSHGGPEVKIGQPIHAGDVLEIIAFWSAVEQPQPATYQSFVHLRDAQGTTLTQRDAPPWQGLFPLPTWPKGALVVEPLDLPLPANLPPGTYHLVLGLYDATTQARFPASVGGVRLANDEVELATFEISP